MPAYTLQNTDKMHINDKLAARAVLVHKRSAQVLARLSSSKKLEPKIRAEPFYFTFKMIIFNRSFFY